MIAPLLLAMGVAASSPPAAAPLSKECAKSSPDEVLVCGHKTERYRIDPNVLEAQREHDALPAKPPVTAEAVQPGGCVGGQGCEGGVIPLIGVAIVAAKAVALAAKGDDWRDAIRIHPDEYRLYKEAEERRAKERRPRIGFSVGN